MAIDYVLAVGCEPQRRLGVERLVALHRTRIQARAIVAQLSADGEVRSPDLVHVELATRQTTGDSTRGVTLQHLIDEAAPLDEVAGHCDHCPVALPRAFACHRRIRYPIPEHAEAWLVGRLPDALGCTAGALLVRGLREFGWDGEPTARLRAAGTTFFESRAPYGVRWQGDDGAIEISSDQLFQMMFLVGHLAPTHSLMLSLFFGVIPHAITPHDLKDPVARARALDLAEVPPEPDPDIEQLAGFLRTLALAARRDLTLLIDG